MNKVKAVFVLGIWVAILPYLGFPYSLKNILYSITGLVLMYSSFVMYRDFKKISKMKEKTFDNFSENKDFNENEKI
jgi:hypothetical protein